MVPVLIAAAAISAAASATAGGMKIGAANKQDARSRELMDRAAGIIAPSISQEFYDTLNIKTDQYLGGMPGADMYRSMLGNNTSNAVKAISEQSGSGGDSLTALSGIYGQQMNAELSIDTQEAGYKDQALNNIASTVWNIGEQKEQMEAVARGERSKLQGQASALENAATANRMQGATEIVKGVASGATAALGGVAGAGSAAGSFKGVMGQLGGAIDTSGLKTGASGSDPNNIDAGSMKENVSSALNANGNEGYVTAMQNIGMEATTNTPETATVEELMKLQSYLNASGYKDGNGDPLVIDGKYGPKTTAALYAYSQSMGSTGTPYMSGLSGYYQ